jgi:hypothetical protein
LCVTSHRCHRECHRRVAADGIAGNAVDEQEVAEGSRCDGRATEIALAADALADADNCEYGGDCREAN